MTLFYIVDPISQTKLSSISTHVPVHSENWATEAGCDGLVITGDADGGAVVLRHLLAADHHHVEQEQLLVSIILGR